MASYARRTNLIEGVGNEVLLGLSAFTGALIAALYFVNSRGQQTGTIHPDSEGNVATTRERLQNEAEHVGDVSLGGARPSRRTHHRNDGQLSCPICLGSAVLAVETNCGHVFCGHCMVTYWQHQTWLGAIRCPSCRTQVSLLLLNFTAEEHAADSDERREVINKINQYNRRFSGEPRTIQEYLQDLPTLLRHAFHEFFSVGGLMWMFRFRIGILVLAAFLYLISPLDILPEAVFGIIGFLDDIFIILLLAIYISIIYRQVITARAGDG
ncbi:E3 ubiquitin-protein ligase rnf170 [Plakobranchus ocellatus]|uniref:E3 ubiquitin-protein ligase RNF170 n=1 Tax=Plakobranchus ocellatus TaxID=259542 RepID=A0AAV4A7I2_9GAST|nr:E3 ubiquitin-protein ligase rnf170 [Plakobranchus ocellatus]